jgi:hypothetical protein
LEKKKKKKKNLGKTCFKRVKSVFPAKKPLILKNQENSTKKKNTLNTFQLTKIQLNALMILLITEI